MICSMMVFIGQRLLLFSRHSNVKISWIKYQIHKDNGVPEYQQSSSGTKISPAVLFIIIILAILFFISGLLHLLVRFLTKQHTSSNSRESNRFPDGSPSDALQRQLQQLFHLHDSGLDQSFIDALHVFMYKELVVATANEAFHCAVCLCEFSETDKLRLLPACSHAFHINCIDTWLLSNSTCPLCRNALFDPGFSDNPMFDFDDPREPHDISFSAGFNCVKTIETELAENRGLTVRLGKFRKQSEGEGESETIGETSSRNVDARRCYSMGSYAYVVGDTDLRISLSHLRDLQDLDLVKNVDRNELNERIDDSVAGDANVDGKKINLGVKTDSFSVSKIWLWSKKRKFASSSGNQMHNPSTVDMELPRIGRFEGA